MTIDHVAFKFKSHNAMLYICVQLTGQQTLLSRPFQLALGVSIVPYRANISESESFTIGLIQSKEWPSANNFAKDRYGQIP